jgi:iron-sulfur cluster assembly accessory protein
MIHFSPAALVEIQRLQIKQLKHANGFLRLGMAQGGCSGWVYRLEWTEVPQPQENQLIEQGIRILVDPEQLSFLQGLNLDYSEDLMGGGFRFHNPQAQQTCGCGQSFSPVIKMPEPPTSSANLGADI